ncbi:nitrogen permease regulator 3-like protein [Sarcoptes scabiei]|uniref:GATOR complex protein NPRL3 n=1 Tax=Sarcoptes scabiei TaxID=52283 RepID=A0A132AAX9_SARSC|nr:nitrogen permease regulator 3-like protein [Sarcoptes scabiei]
MIDSIDDLSNFHLSDETTPLGVFLVKSDSAEEKLLFRYPFLIEETVPSIQFNQSRYALMIPDQESNRSNRSKINDQAALLPAYTELTSSISTNKNDQNEITKIIGLTDSAFSNLFGTVKHRLCDHKFELKIDNVRFVGHPTLVDKHRFHVVFALKANAQHDVVDSYHELSQHISIALRSEERPNELKRIFLQLCNEGIVSIKLNQWINLNFCLSQKVHRRLVASPSAPLITPANIKLCLKKLRPYHTFLLLIDMDVLLKSLPHDVSPSFVRLIKISNPLKNLLELSADADITLSQIFNIVAQLVYWGKATIIFPLCESNHYMLHPSASTAVDSKMKMDFEEQFVGESLLQLMSKFSLGVSLGQFKNPLDSSDQESKFVQIIVWMLRKRLLLQLHMYALFVPLQNPLPRRSKDENSGRKNSKPSLSDAPTIDQSLHLSSSSSDPSLGNQNDLKYDSESNILIQQSFSIIENSSIELNNLHNGSHHIDDLSLKESSESILQNTGLTADEISAILSLPSAENLDDIRMFARLIPYLDGHHHIEDIMYYENLRRSHILTLIDKFRDVLIICQYEDTTVAELLPYNTVH